MVELRTELVICATAPIIVKNRNNVKYQIRYPEITNRKVKSDFETSEQK